MSNDELGKWLQERGLGDFTDTLANAGCEGLEALLELEESSLVAALSPSKQQTTAVRHLLGELEALRCPPLPSSIREKIVELGPQHLACLAAVVERSPILASPSDGRVFPDQRGEECQPAGRLCARLDSRLWVRKGPHSPRRWYFEIAPDTLQVLALPEFASFKACAQVLFHADEDTEKKCWSTAEESMPHIAPILQKGSQVRMQLLIVTGFVTMMNPAAANTLDYEALVMAKEHSLQSYVCKLCFALRGVVDFGPGEHQCKLTLGCDAAARPVVCRGASLEALLENVVQTALSLSATCRRHWELIQFVTDSLNDLFELAEIDVDVGAPGGAEGFRVTGRQVMEDDQEKDDTKDQLEVEVMQLYNITIGTKFAGSGQTEEKAQQVVERGLRDVATGLADDTGKQVRVVVKQITPHGIVVQLALICAELAEVEQVLGARARCHTGHAGLSSKSDLTEDLRAAIGIPSRCRSSTPSTGRTKAYSLISPGIPTERRLSTGMIKASTLRSPGKGQRLRSLPPMESQGSSKTSKRSGSKPTGPKLEPQSVGALAGKIFQALDFDNSTYLTAAKLQWGLEHVAPVFEFACPGFGPSSFHASEHGTAHAYYHFLDEDENGRISEKQFSQLFIKAAELRPAQAAELEGLLRHAHKRLESQASGGVVLCGTDGQRSVVARSGQQVEIIYSFLPERVTKIQSTFRCAESLGPRAALAILPAGKVINSPGSLLSTAIALTPLDTRKACGRAVLALPAIDAMVRDCAVRVCILDEGGQRFVQLGELPCQLRGPPSVQHMAISINTALAGAHAEEATREYREEAYSVLEQIKSNSIQPEVVVAARRDWLPRLQQLLCSRTLLREQDLIPLSPYDLKILNVGRNNVLPIGERPLFQCRVVGGAVGYLIMVIRDPRDMEYPYTGSTFSYFVEDGNLDKTYWEDEGVWLAQFALPELLLGRYVVYVKARGVHGYGAWSSTCSFFALSAQEVANMESVLQEGMDRRDQKSLQEALKKIEYYWVVDQKLVKDAQDRCRVLDLEMSLRVGINTANMPQLEQSLRQAGKLRDIKGTDFVDNELLQDAALKFGQMLAVQIKEMLGSWGTLTGPGGVTSLQSMIDRLISIPGNGQEKLIYEANDKIALYRHGPKLQEAISLQDVEKLQAALLAVTKLGYISDKRLAAMVNEALILLRRLCEDAITKAMQKNTYDELKAAIAKAKVVQDLFTVQSSASKSRVQEGSATGISQQVILDGERHIEYLKFVQRNRMAEAKEGN